MSEPKELTTELEEALGNAWSYDGKPPGKYIGSVVQGGRKYYFYKDGKEYYYENEFDLEMRHKKKLRRRRKNE